MSVVERRGAGAGTEAGKGKDPTSSRRSHHHRSRLEERDTASGAGRSLAIDEQNVQSSPIDVGATERPEERSESQRRIRKQCTEIKSIWRGRRSRLLPTRCSGRKIESDSQPRSR